MFSQPVLLLAVWSSVLSLCLASPLSAVTSVDAPMINPIDEIKSMMETIVIPPLTQTLSSSSSSSSLNPMLSILDSKIRSTTDWISMRVATIHLPEVTHTVSKVGALSYIMLASDTRRTSTTVTSATTTSTTVASTTDTSVPVSTDIASAQIQTFNHIFLCLPSTVKTISTATATPLDLHLSVVTAMPTTQSIAPATTALSKTFTETEEEPELGRIQQLPVGLASDIAGNPSSTTSHAVPTHTMAFSGPWSNITRRNAEHRRANAASNSKGHGFVIRRPNTEHNDLRNAIRKLVGRDASLQEEDSTRCSYPTVNGYKLMRDGAGQLVLDMSRQAPWGDQMNAAPNATSSLAARQLAFDIEIELRLILLGGGFILQTALS